MEVTAEINLSLVFQPGVTPLYFAEGRFLVYAASIVVGTSAVFTRYYTPEESNRSFEITRQLKDGKRYEKVELTTTQHSVLDEEDAEDKLLQEFGIFLAERWSDQI